MPRKPSHKSKAGKRLITAKAISAFRARKNWRQRQVRKMKRPHCPSCKRGFNKTDRIPTVDHIIPLAKGGVDKKENWQLMCQFCNYKKGCRL